jgi:folate-binding protein YgfZ
MTVQNARAGIARLSRRLLSLSGPDAAKFLQGMMSAAILTRDGKLIPRDGAVYSGFFTPQGRVQHDILVYPRPPQDRSQEMPDYLVEVDGNEASKLVKRLRFYKLRAKFAMRVVEPEELSVYHLWDDAGGQAIKSIEGKLGEGEVLSQDPRLAALGYRLLARGDKAPGVDLGEVGEDSYRLRRYLQGVAEGQDEIPMEHALPLEYNMELLGGVNFQKGCYVGQELQARTKYLGIVHKRVLPCVLYDGPTPEALEYTPETGAVSATDIPNDTAIDKIWKEGEKPSRRDRKPGKWIAGIGNVGIAICRLSAMTDVVPPHPPDMPINPTFTPDTEFKVDTTDGKSVKVKAFAPEWLRQGLVGYRD